MPLSSQSADRYNDAETSKLQNEILLLEKELEGLEQENDRLVADGMVGFNPKTTKILELRDNPDTQEHAVRTSTLRTLRAENQALLSRIEELQQRTTVTTSGDGGSSLDTVPRESYDSLQAELKATEQALKQKEIREDRIKQVRSFDPRTAEGVSD